MDLVVGAPGTNTVKIISGQPADAGLVLASVTGAAGSRFGAAVAGLGNTGYLTAGEVVFAVGAPNTATSVAAGGRAFVYAPSGATATLLATLDNPRAPCATCVAANDQFGLTVLAAGDVTRDALADVLVGTPYANERTTVPSNQDITTVETGLAVVYTKDKAAQVIEGGMITGGDPNNGVPNAGGSESYVFANLIQVAYAVAAGDMDSDRDVDLLFGGAGRT
jgi:hypothetical protein